MRGRKTIIFNSKSIESWNKELSEIPKEIEKQEKIINDTKPLINNLKEQVRPIQNQIDSIEQQIHSLNMQLYLQQFLQIIENIIAINTEEKNDHDVHVVHALTHGFLTVGLQLQINNLVNELTQFNNQVAPLKDALNEQESVANNARESIQNLFDRKKLIEEDYLPHSAEFLDKLRNQPDQLFYTLREDIIKNFKEFDKNHFFQDDEIRVCLFDCERKLNCILKDNFFENMNSDYADFIQPQLQLKEWRIKYLQLCGFLWSMDSKQSSSLVNPLLEKTHIDENGHLPDDMKTVHTCLNTFNIIRNKNSILFDIPHEQFVANEIAIFNDALQTMKEYANHATGILQIKTRRLINEVEKEIVAKQRETIGEFQIYTYTKILNQTYLYLTDPYNVIENEKNFLKLAVDVSGVPSVSKQVIGALMGVVGTIVLGTSIALSIPSFGIGLIGIGIGISLLSQFLAISTCVGGIGLTAAGVGLFSEGRRKGISKEIIELHNTIKTQKNENTQLYPKLSSY